MMNAKKRLVVIGNGMAGARVVQEILKRVPEMFDITMIGAEPYGNYNRILLSNVLGGMQQAEETFINPLSWYQENGITLHAGFKAIKIDREKKQVICRALNKDECPYSQDGVAGPVAEQTWRQRVGPPKAGDRPPGSSAPPAAAMFVAYDKVVIATGSRPFLPPIENFEGPGTFLFRTLDDCARIAEYAQESARAAVIGGGLLGLEAARGLMAHDVKVIVLEAGPQLMPAQLDEEGGRLLKSTLEAMGISVFCGKITAELKRVNDRPKQLIFKDGYTLATDMVVVSAGIRPITEVAVASGLVVKRGIVCNDHMQTNDPDIFALGECVEHRDRLYGLVEPIWEMAKTLADVITEKNPKARYAGSRLATKLKVLGVELTSMGRSNPIDDKDEVTIYREPRRGIYQKLIIRDDHLVGGILLGESTAADTLMRIFKDDTKVVEKRTELLFGATEAASLSDVSQLPDAVQICNCNGVSKRDILRAIQGHGCSSVAQVGNQTKAGKGCGSCKGMITQLIAAYASAVSYDESEHYYVPGIPLEKSQLIATIKEKKLKSVSAVFRELADGKERADSKVGLASLLKSIWPAEYEDERDARFINDRVHANIQRDGTFSVVPRIYGGVTSPDELIRIGTVAKKFNVPMLKLTGGQRIDLLGIRKEDLPKIWKELGLPSGHAYTKAVRTVKSCVGTDFCRFGLGNSIGLAQEIEQYYQGIETPHKVKMAAAGCPRNCSEAYVKDVGVVAIEGGEWELYVGGAAGGTVRKGDRLCTVKTHRDVLKYIGRFLQYYREHAKYLERTYDFVARIGIDRLKTILIADELGICIQLDHKIRESVTAQKDPWVEAVLPAYPAQFKGPQLVKLLEEAENNG